MHSFDANMPFGCLMDESHDTKSLFENMILSTFVVRRLRDAGRRRREPWSKEAFTVIYIHIYIYI